VNCLIETLPQLAGFTTNIKRILGLPQHDVASRLALHHGENETRSVAVIIAAFVCIGEGAAWFEDAKTLRGKMAASNDRKTFYFYVHNSHLVGFVKGSNPSVP
jgi:hypothetical protein